MTEININNLLISGSCNSEYENFDWFGSVVAYGCDNLIYIYDTVQIKILCTLKGHKGRVNCVRFFDDGKILSVCASGSAIIWENSHFTRDSIEKYLETPEFHSDWNASETVKFKKRNIIQYSILKNTDNEYYATMLTT
jgi:WD40 repeat protein